MVLLTISSFHSRAFSHNYQQEYNHVLMDYGGSHEKRITSLHISVDVAISDGDMRK